MYSEHPVVAAPPPLFAENPRRIRGDLRFMRLYAHTVKRSMVYHDHKETLAADPSATAVAERIECGLRGEAKRYRMVGWTILAVILAPMLLSAFMWWAMYWLPVKYNWLPFERGMYHLPYFSLFEWSAYLIIAAYFVVTWGYITTSHDETLRLGTEYRRLAAASPEYRAEIVEALRSGEYPRTECVVTRAKVFADYAEALAEERPS
jgi:hypothetical protein